MDYGFLFISHKNSVTNTDIPVNANLYCMSIDRNTANANTLANVAILQTAADANFIANVDSQITQAIAAGSFSITAQTNTTVNLMTVFQHYANLGYAVSFPDYANQNGNQLPSIINQPQNFFGYNYVAFFAGLITINVVQNPARMTISWA